MSIDVKDIRKTFGDFVALDTVSLHIDSGELIALLGPSGSGKTTLLRIIAGLEFADSGQVVIDGEVSSGQRMQARKVGFVFQHYALFKHMSVFENVAFGLRVQPKPLRLPKPAIAQKVMELLKLVHLDSFHNRYPHELSGGQRQRVALARSLAVEPKLLLLDEPFGALDAKVRKELRRWLRRLHEEMHITSIFVTHDQDEAMDVADRVVVMNQGRIEQVGTPEEVYHHPANGFVYDFLGNYNEFAGWRDDDGSLHLAGDDLWDAAALPATTAQTAKPSWLALHAGMGGLLRKILPDLKQPAHGGKAKPARQRMRALLAERGTPLRAFTRPHEMYITKTPDEDHEYVPAHVTHINPAGALATVELQRKNGTMLQVEVPKEITDSLGLRKGDQVFVRPKNVKVFE